MYLIFKFVVTNEDKNILSRSKYLGSMCIFLRRPLDLLFYGMALICFLCVSPCLHQTFLCCSSWQQQQIVVYKLVHSVNVTKVKIVITRRDAKKIMIIFFFMLKVKIFFARNPHDDMLAVSKV